MRSIEEVRTVLELVEEGLNDCEISRRTGIPRKTILGWRHGKIPRRGRLAHRIPAEESCPVCGHPMHRFDLLPRADYAYLLGMYLGDGSISTHRRGVHRLGITLDRRYQGIVNECAAAMASVLPSSKVGIQRYGHMNADFVYSYSKAWPCLFPQHGRGKKHLRRIELASWQETLVEREPRKLLRGLIHSDGCYVANMAKCPKKTYFYPRYQFSNMSSEIKTIFCNACDRLGIEWRVMNHKTISVARRDSVAMMDEFIGPKT